MILTLQKSITERFDGLVLPRVTRPSKLIPGWGLDSSVGSKRRIAICVPQGSGRYQALLDSLLSIQGTDFSFLPPRDLKSNLKREGFPLLSLVGRKAIQEFELLVYLVLDPLDLVFVPAHLASSGIPVLKDERKKQDPHVAVWSPPDINLLSLKNIVNTFLTGDPESYVMDWESSQKDAALDMNSYHGTITEEQWESFNRPRPIFWPAGGGPWRQHVEIDRSWETPSGPSVAWASQEVGKIHQETGCEELVLQVGQAPSSEKMESLSVLLRQTVHQRSFRIVPPVFEARSSWASVAFDMSGERYGRFQISPSQGPEELSSWASAVRRLGFSSVRVVIGGVLPRDQARMIELVQKIEEESDRGLSIKINVQAIWEGKPDMVIWNSFRKMLHRVSHRSLFNQRGYTAFMGAAFQSGMPLPASLLSLISTMSLEDLSDSHFEEKMWQWCATSYSAAERKGAEISSSSSSFLTLPLSGGPSAPSKAQRVSQRLRLKLSRMERARYLSHLEQIEVIRAVLRRAGWPLARSGGKKNSFRISFGPAISVGYSSDSEYCDVDLTSRLDLDSARESLSRALPSSMRCMSIRRIPLHFPSLEETMNVVLYHVRRVNPGSSRWPEDTKEKIDAFLLRPSVLVARRKEGKEEMIDVRPLLLRLQKTGDEVIEILMRFGPKKNVKPQWLLREVFGWDEESVPVLDIRKIALYSEKSDGTLLEP